MHVSSVGRCKKFRAKGSIYEEKNGKPHFIGIDFNHLTEEVLELFFFRELFNDAVQAYPLGGHGALHATVLHSLSHQLVHALGLDELSEPRAAGYISLSTKSEHCFFGRKKAFDKDWISWDELCQELLQEGYQRIDLAWTERIYKTLDDFGSCRLAYIWFSFMMVTTFANMSGIAFPDFPRWVTVSLLHLDDGWASYLFKDICVYIFTVDYVTKLVLSPFVRLHIIDAEVLKNCVKNINAVCMTGQSRKQRLGHYLQKYSNVIDLIAILPFWFSVLFADLGLNTSFLRLVRLARLFRLFKTARNLQMLQILALTLMRSLSMVVLLCVIVGIIGLICGCLLHQLESNNHVDEFDTVPSAWFWVITRLISMKDVPNHDGTVFSVAGIILLTITMTMKCMLWIVPIARIKKIFHEEYRRITELDEMRKALWDWLFQRTVENNWTGKQGLSWGRLYGTGPSGSCIATFALPLLRSRKESVSNMHVEFQDVGQPKYACVDMNWNPSPSMRLTAPVMPEGQLHLSLKSISGFPANMQWSLQVPTNLFSYTTMEICVDNTVIFNIRWEAEGQCDNHHNTSSVPAMLQEQSSILRRQNMQLKEVVGAQTNHIQEMSNRVAALEMRIRGTDGVQQLATPAPMSWVL